MTLDRIFNFLAFALTVIILGAVFLTLTWGFSTILSPIFLGGFSGLLAIGAIWHFGIPASVAAMSQRLSAKTVATVYNVFHWKSKISAASFNQTQWGWVNSPIVQATAW